MAGLFPFTPKRLKNVSLLAGVLLNGLTMMTWTGQWFVLHLANSQTGHPDLAVTGDVAAPGLVALSLAGLASIAAIALAGPVFRVVLGALHAVIGACVILSGVVAVANPIGASATLITRATGVAGAESMASLVSSVDQTAWPWVAVILGALSLILGLLIAGTARVWPNSTRRYQPVQLSAEGPHSTVDDWDDLSDGKDPTST